MGRAEVQAVDEVYQVGRQHSAVEVAELKGRLQEQAEREKRVAECHQVIGRIQATQMFVKFGNVSELMWIKDVKNSGIYKDVPGLETWEKFCNSVGYTAHHINDQLKNLEVFGAGFLETVSDLRVGYRDLKKLRQLTHEGAVQIEDDTVTIGGEMIPLDADHREDLQAALERVIDAKDALLLEKDAVIRSNDKLLQSKQELIRRQEKDLARYENEAAKKGFTPDEDALLKRLEKYRATFDGLIHFLDPTAAPLTEDATPCMKAAYLEALGYMRRLIEAAHDTATDLYSTATFDNDWVPPFERKEG